MPRRQDRHGVRLTARELEVLRYVATGATNAQIGTRLDISTDTVKCHVAHALAKLDVPNRTAAVAAAVAGGLIPLDYTRSRELAVAA